MVDLKENKGFYLSNDIACIEKASKPEHLYSNVLIIMINRMLKLLTMVLRHRLVVEPELASVFKEVAAHKSKMTDAFSLTVQRITMLEQQLAL